MQGQLQSGSVALARDPIFGTGCSGCSKSLRGHVGVHDRGSLLDRNPFVIIAVTKLVSLGYRAWSRCGGGPVGKGVFDVLSPPWAPDYLTYQ